MYCYELCYVCYTHPTVSHDLEDSMKNTLTYDDVAQAAALLLSKNERPTTRSLRLIVGRGSFGTISRYLNEWREKALPTSGPAPPEESLSAEFRQSMGKEIARHLKKGTQEKDDEISRLMAEIQEALSENDRLEALCTDQEGQIKGLAQEDVRKTERATLLGSHLADEKTRSQDLLERLHKAEKTIVRLEVLLETANTLRDSLEKQGPTISVTPALSTNRQRQGQKPLTKPGKFMTLETEANLEKDITRSPNGKKEGGLPR
jgi:hypothetical protein